MKIISELTTEELHERIFHATTELIEREVAKKFETDMEAVARVTASVDEPAPLTPNQQRYETNQRAREFVESLMFEGNDGVGKVVDGLGGHNKVEFVVNKKKRRVDALLKFAYVNDRGLSKGIAKCMPGDVFNEWIGKAIALARALGIDIPQEFTDAVQPDEVVVGMFVKYGQGEPLKVMEGLEIENSPREYTHRTTARDSPRTQIIDDTIAEYEIYE